MSDKKTIKDVIDILKGEWSGVRTLDYVNCGWGLVLLKEYFRGNPKHVLNIQYDGVAICDKDQFEDYIETLIKDSTEGYYINTVKDAYENLKGEYRENSSYKFIVYNKDSCSFSFYPDADIEDNLYIVCSMKELIDYANNLNDIKGEDKMSDNKKIKEAVRLYQGSFPDGACGCYDGWELESEWLFYDSFFICTRKEFEDYAKMMELNKLNKEAVKIDEPTVSYISTEEYRDFNFDADAFNVEFAKSWVENNIQFTGVKEAVKPVYTQEMSDNGELPPVGSLVEVEMDYTGDNGHDSGLFNVEVLGTQVYCDKLNVIVESMIDSRDLIRVNKFKPIDTRTDEEKLIDEVAKLLRNIHNEDLGLVKTPETFRVSAKNIIKEVNKLK